METPMAGKMKSRRSGSTSRSFKRRVRVVGRRTKTMNEGTIERWNEGTNEWTVRGKWRSKEKRHRRRKERKERGRDGKKSLYARADERGLLPGDDYLYLSSLFLNPAASTPRTSPKASRSKLEGNVIAHNGSFLSLRTITKIGRIRGGREEKKVLYIFSTI